MEKDESSDRKEILHATRALSFNWCGVDVKWRCCVAICGMSYEESGY